MNPIDALIIQLSGIFLIGVLTFFLTKSLKSTALLYWRNAWLALSFALFNLLIYFATGHASQARPFVILYYAFEYIFGIYLIAGCRNFSSGKTLSNRTFWLLIPIAAFSVFITYDFSSFNSIFNLHSAIMAGIFLTSFIFLKASVKNSLNNYGWYVMKTALFLLVIGFVQRIFVFTLLNTQYKNLVPARYHIYVTMADLVFEILLGFGIVTILLERVRKEAEETNQKLREAHEKLKQLANVDPLTTAFTRHAFYNFLKSQKEQINRLTGCVGVFDIDNLKPVNDGFGHFVGDIAIRTVSNHIRSLIRADDMIFRWGGDEFFVIMLGFYSGGAESRMKGLNRGLENVTLKRMEHPVSISVSYGFADFEDINDLEKAMQQADTKMYRIKEKRKQQKQHETLYSLPDQTGTAGEQYYEQ